MQLIKQLSLLWVFSLTLLGLVIYGLEHPWLGQRLWMGATLPVLIWLLVDIVKNLRDRAFGVDLIAAIAMVAALFLDEYLAAAVIALMFASGQALEQYAAHRSARELTTLLNRVPKQTDRYSADGLETVPVEQVKPGDRLLIKTGAVLPVDGYVDQTSATIDESSLTGESLPVIRSQGQAVTSGTVNLGQPFDLITVRDADNSTYADVVRLVQEAQTGKAPFTRMADRYALWLIPFTLIVAGFAWWISGDPVRALAVLVVATPCPLILAAPIAIVSGISTAARQGLLIKNGAALETLANAQRLIIDKTGTLTTGNPRLVDIESDGRIDKDQILQLAASLEQASFHSVSDSIVQSAKQRRLPLLMPTQVNESTGKGLQGFINQQAIMIGQPQWVMSQTPTPDWVKPLLERARHEGSMVILIAIDHKISGALLLQDELRADSPRALRRLRAAGLNSLVMASGDQKTIAETLGSALGMDKIYAELSPEDKVKVVSTEREYGTTVMVGDGFNDAPALAIADVGIAMGARGSGASSEAADAVLMVDRLDALADGLQIAQRSQRIAKQSVIAGMSLSAVAMMFAAMGYLTPLAGAVLQEAIDVLVIMNALRALQFSTGQPVILSYQQQQALQQEHLELQPVLDKIVLLADKLSANQPMTLSQLTELGLLLQQRLIPHEQLDERHLHPELARDMVGQDPLAAFSHTHREILQLCWQYLHQLDTLGERLPEEHQRQAMVAVLYALSAILKLHFSQENELYALLASKGQANSSLRG